MVFVWGGCLRFPASTDIPRSLCWRPFHSAALRERDGSPRPPLDSGFRRNDAWDIHPCTGGSQTLPCYDRAPFAGVKGLCLYSRYILTHSETSAMRCRR